MAEHVSRVLVETNVFLLLFIGRAFAFVGKIPDLLSPRVQFSKLSFRVRYAGNSLSRRFLHFFSITNEVLGVFTPHPPGSKPELLQTINFFSPIEEGDV